MEYLLPALQDVLTPISMIALIGGVLYGILIGAIPGLGSVIAVTLILPITYSMDLVPSVVLVLAVYASSIYGGSITAVLINTPGTPNSAATCLDGYPMTLRGEAHLALGWVTMASAIGGMFSIFVLLVAARPLASIALSFGTPETFALICLAMASIISVTRDSVVKGLASAVLGLFLATIGLDPMTGDMRFDFGYFPLTAGINLIAVLMGVFAIGEVLYQFSVPSASNADVKVVSSGLRFPPLKMWIERRVTLIKACLIGSFIGILPGTGGAMAAFITYAETRRAGRFRDRLGTGEPEGLIATEASNNAVTGGALVPTLALGIPGDVITAVMLSALLIQGVTPGVRMLEDNPEILYVAFVALGFANIGILVVGTLTARLWTKVLKVPRPLLYSLIIAFALVGAYGARGNIFDMYVALIAGVVGFLMRLGKFPTVPLVIGMVLGPMFETTLRQSIILNHGGVGVFIVEHPVADILLLIALGFIMLPMLQSPDSGLRRLLSRQSRTHIETKSGNTHPGTGK